MKLLFRSTLVLVLALAGCATPEVVTREVTVEVRVPVVQPCARAGPDRPEALRSNYPDAVWQAMDVRQKTAAVSAAGLRWQTYGEQTHAATAGCPRIP